MAMSSLRPLMCAGVVVGGLVVAGPVAGVAIADPGQSDDTGNRDSSTSGKRDTDRKPGLSLGSRNDDGSGGVRKRRSFGISLDRSPGRDDRTDDPVDEKSDGDGARKPGRVDIRVPGGRQNLPLPQVRVSVGADTGREPDTCSGSNCLAALRVAAPGVSAEVSLFSQPEPEPEPPGPAFRGGPEDVDPVVDAGGAGDPGQFIEGSPGVLEVPMIVAPPPVPVSVVGVAPLPAVVPGAPAGAPSPGLFGIQAPLPSPASGGPMMISPGANAPALQGSGLASGATTRLGLPSATRAASPLGRWVGALPGLSGLLMVTACGGFIGYRQANAGRYVRAGGADRFLV